MALGNFKLENLPRNAQIALIAGMAIVLGAVGYVFYLKDAITTRSTLLGEIAKLESSIAQASEVESRLAKFKQDVAILDARLDELRRILPSQKETPDVMRAVQNMAADSSLHIVKFAPQAVAPRAFYADWPITMDVQGSYNALGSFMEKVGQFRRIINVDNISVKIIDGSTDPGRTLSANFTATTFVYRDEPVAPPAK
jgi:type IV pilus assembly protein PilO